MRLMAAKFPGTCATCGQPVVVGERIAYNGRAHHEGCVSGQTSQQQAAKPSLTLKRTEALGGGFLFVWVGGPETKDAPKSAGLRWHGGDCRRGCLACAAQLGRVWWTVEPAQARRLAQYADAAAKAALAEHEERLASSRAAEGTVEQRAAITAEGSVAAGRGWSYLPYQVAGIAYCLARPKALVGDEMGLGKTIQAIGVHNADASVQSMLIVCPASLRSNWAREVTTWATRPVRVEVIESTSQRLQEPAEGATTVVVVNYDLVRKGPLRDALMARDWDLLVIDEAHRAKNPEAQQTRSVLGTWDKEKKEAVPGLVQRARRVVALTGTPVPNRPIEIQPLLAALGVEWAKSRFGFAKRYANATQTRYGWDMDGASNLDELQEKLRAAVMVRRVKSQVLTELPAKRRQVIVMPTNGAARAVTAEQEAVAAREELLAALRDAVALAHAAGDDAAYAAAVEELQSAVKIAFEDLSDARRGVAMAKLPACIEHCRDVVESAGKVVIFAHHHEVVDALREGLAEFSPAVIDGRVEPRDRQAVVDRFQTDAACRVFIGSIGACREGLTLTAASHVVFVELDWVPGNLSQAEDRCHRIGQRDCVIVQHLVVDGSIDARMASVLVEKQEILDSLLDKEHSVRATAALKEPVFVTRSETSGEKPAPRPSKYPVATDEQRTAAATALQQLAGMCDGAAKKDDCGFNRLDTGIGKALALKSTLRPLTDGEVWLAKRIVPKYHRQIGTEILRALGMSEKLVKSIEEGA